MRPFMAPLLLALSVGVTSAAAQDTLNDPVRAERLRLMIEQRFGERVKEELGLTDDQAMRVRTALGGLAARRRGMEQEERRIRQALAFQLRPGVAANPDSVARLVDALTNHRVAYAQTFRDEMRELSNLFRGAEQFEPSPFLWTRIAADFEKEHGSRHSWGATLIAGLRRYAWHPGLAAAVFGILMIAGIAVFREVNVNVADRAALAEIDKAYQSLAAQNPDSYNPFVSGSSSDDANPFRSSRLRGRTDSDPLVPVRH